MGVEKSDIVRENGGADMNEIDYLADWKAILERRALQTVETFRRSEGVKALILGGSLGRGEPWPLSDIDIIPIYEPGRELTANERIKQLRAELIEEWEREGWRTALDVGTLYWSADLAADVVNVDSTVFEGLFDNLSVYHSLDKAYLGQAVYDPERIGADLLEWIRRNRFAPEVTALRRSKLRRRFEISLLELDEAIENRLWAKAAYYGHEAIELLRTYVLESWGDRDNSFARLGTRFERLAELRGCRDLAERFHTLKKLDDSSVLERIQRSPEWVRERHRLSYASRRMIGEDVSEIQDARDVLRVFGRYELRSVMNGAETGDTEWLAIPRDADEFAVWRERMVQLGGSIFSLEKGGEPR
ncbi:nucleotidyltransferase domain-containing protein [Paenibacillus ginsengarvi]|uniref:Polymerase nucleotidyl transferase domain-containing protein n=1 Tax=Paenibacillus ginsengarvi TaxID=400777 RepID=A0A3B0CIA6_9BACL|nr:nucleotidyltransferase domain-containing protein [Paenibacillus ginsengarvi]RKN85405.1 hypothetical protein D7M11_06830 [Paenibacillus ginsengarvi]